jgi:hypothetical protein
MPSPNGPRLFARPRAAQGPTLRRLPLPCALAATVLGLLLSASTAAAQEPPPDDWNISVDLGLDASGGNTDLIILRSALGVGFVGSERVEFDFNAAFRYGEDDGEVIERQSRASLKMDLDPQEAWSPFAFASGFRDAPRRRLDFRGELGVGAKYTFVRTDPTEASISVAGIGTTERFTAVEGLETPEDKNQARVSWRTRLEHEFGETASVDQILFYQPVWDTWGDYLFVAQTSVRTTLVGELSLVVSHEFTHDETPAETVAKDDWTFNLGLRYEF